MMEKGNIDLEKLSELMEIIIVNDEIIFDNEFGVFKIIKLEDVQK